MLWRWLTLSQLFPFPHTTMGGCLASPPSVEEAGEAPRSPWCFAFQAHRANGEWPYYLRYDAHGGEAAGCGRSLRLNGESVASPYIPGSTWNRPGTTPARSRAHPMLLRQQVLGAAAAPVRRRLGRRRRRIRGGGGSVRADVHAV